MFKKGHRTWNEGNFYHKENENIKWGKAIVILPLRLSQVYNLLMRDAKEHNENIA